MFLQCPSSMVSIGKWLGVTPEIWLEWRFIWFGFETFRHRSVNPPYPLLRPYHPLSLQFRQLSFFHFQDKLQKITLPKIYSLVLIRRNPPPQIGTFQGLAVPSLNGQEQQGLSVT